MEEVQMLVIERILRNREGVWHQIVAEERLGQLIGKMVLDSSIALALYGLVLGFFHSWYMALTSLVKLPLLIGLTLAICLPTLYLFNLVFGARLTVKQAVSLVMVAVTVMSTMAVAFAPISLFFLITADDYAFFKLLNVAILALSAIVGLRFLTSGMRVLQTVAVHLAEVERAEADRVAARAEQDGQVEQPVAEPALVGGGDAQAQPGEPAGQQLAIPQQPIAQQPYVQQQLPPGAVLVPGGFVAPGIGFVATGPRPQVPAGPPKPSMALVNIWIVLFGFVGTQLAWTLRPFFGSPGEPFEFFRQIEGNFYAEIVRTIGDLFT
jgi:hypothetical protein